MPRRSSRSQSGKKQTSRTKPSASRKKASRSKSGGKSAGKSGPSARKKTTRKRSVAAKTDQKVVAETSKKARTKRAKKASQTRQQPQRLQRLLASAGFGSRRQCEELIKEGRVEIDGKVVTELGTAVDPKVNKVRVDGTALRQQKLVYYAVNKPTGVLSTNADPKGRRRVVDLVPNSERVFPVGRLDASSQGLMLLTNDGNLAQQLSHPRYGVRKVYRVTVAGKIDAETMRSMRKGIYIAEGFVRVEGARIIKSRAKATELEITLREGKNREIRRILARLGHKVQVLRRIAIGPLRLGDVPNGMYRSLTRAEIDRLRVAVEYSRQEVEGEVETKKSSGKRSAAPKGRNKTSKRKPVKGKQRAESRGDVTKRRTNRKPATTKFSFEPKSKEGPVIGGD